MAIKEKQITEEKDHNHSQKIKLSNFPASFRVTRKENLNPRSVANEARLLAYSFTFGLPHQVKHSICTSDFMQTSFFYLEIFLEKLADDQLSSIIKGSIYHVPYQTYVYTTFYHSTGLTRNWV